MTLTRDDILKMEAGRDIDELITAKIISTDGFWHGVKPYSTDVTAAFQIVGKLIKPDWGWKIESFHMAGELMWSACYRGDTEEGIDYYTATANTVQLAICKAALYTML